MVAGMAGGTMTGVGSEEEFDVIVVGTAGMNSGAAVFQRNSGTAMFQLSSKLVLFSGTLGSSLTLIPLR